MTAADILEHVKERAEVRACMEALSREPSRVRSVSARDFLAAMRDRPGQVAEFCAMLLDGTYGAGWKAEARAAKLGITPLKDLLILVAAVEWQCPQREASAAFMELYIEERDRLQRLIFGK